MFCICFFATCYKTVQSRGLDDLLLEVEQLDKLEQHVDDKHCTYL